MEATIHGEQGNRLPFPSGERREKIRLPGPISTQVLHKGKKGERWEQESTLENLSTGGLYLFLNRHIPAGACLSFLIRLPNLLHPEQEGIRITAQGKVLRTEPQKDGRHGLGVQFLSYRLM